MAIKLLALDLDGTIVSDLRDISPRVHAAIQRAMAQGVRVVIATGREFEMTKRFARRLNIRTPLICYQGALIQSPDNDTPLMAHTVPTELSRQMIRFARAKKLHLALYTTTARYTELPSPLMRAIFEQATTPPTVVNNLLSTLYQPQPVLKFLFIQPPEESRKIHHLLENEFGDTLHITPSLDTIVEGIMPQVSKGNAVEFVAEYYDIPLAQTLAIGDQDNDIAMIRAAGIGVAMGNATAGARAVANVLAPPLENDGAAWAIEKYVLNGSYD